MGLGDVVLQGRVFRHEIPADTYPPRCGGEKGNLLSAGVGAPGGIVASLVVV